MSVLLAAPVTLFAIALCFKGVRRELYARRPLMLLVFGALSGAVLALLLLSAAPGVVFRYMADIAPGFTLAGSLVFMLLLHVARQRARRSEKSARLRYASRGLMAAFHVLTVCSVLTGLVMGVLTWRYQYAAQANRIYWVTDETIARLSTLIAPSEVPSEVWHCGPRTWQRP